MRGANGVGQLDGGDRPGGRVEVLGPEAHDVTAGREREQPAAAAAPVLVLEHHDPAAAARRTMTTSPGRSASIASVDAAAAAPVAAGVVELGDQRRGTRATSPTSRPRRLALAGELLAVAVELALEGDDVAVGVVLRERQVEQVVRLARGVARARGWRPCCTSGGTTTCSAYGAARRERRRPGRTARTGSSSTIA